MNEPSLRLPALTPIQVRVPLGMSGLLLVFALLKLPTREFWTIGLYFFTSTILFGLTIFLTVRYRHTFMVLDENGIWLDRGHSRQGLPWENVRGYEKRADKFVVLARYGEPFMIPNIAVPDRIEAVYQILDRRIGPDGERIGPSRPADPIHAKIHDYYGNVPAVEMEPGVVYRHGNYAEMQREARMRMISGALVAPLGFALLLAEAWLGSSNGALLIMGSGFVTFGLFNLLSGLRAVRRSSERLIARDGILYRIRDGQEQPLPPPQPKPGRSFQGHPTTRYGKGPFAYVVSHQFLEPDV